MAMMTSQALKFVDFTILQKSRYLGNKTSFLKIRKINYRTLQGLLYGKNIFIAEVTFNGFFVRSKSQGTWYLQKQ